MSRHVNPRLTITFDARLCLFEACVKGLQQPLTDWSTVFRACPLEAAADACTNALFWLSQPYRESWRPRPARKKRPARRPRKPESSIA